MFMSDIASNIISLKNSLPPSVKLVAVSKTRTIDEIMEGYNAGQRLFGENRVQELLIKKDLLPSDIEWHLIGHLQTNKVKHIVPFISMIESVDSLRLLETINAEAMKSGRMVDILLQVHIAREETKFGFSKEELGAMTERGNFKDLKNLRICGVMGMATFTTDKEQVMTEFRYLAELFSDLKSSYFHSNAGFREISMGMSDDYEIAVREGSTIIRVGSLIFGPRLKPKP